MRTGMYLRHITIGRITSQRAHQQATWRAGHCPLPPPHRPSFPAGESWGAVTTEGLLIYALDPTLVFEPFQLEEDITESSVLAKLAGGQQARALLMALHLNLEHITRRVIEAVPLANGERDKGGRVLEVGWRRVRERETGWWIGCLINSKRG